MTTIGPSNASDSSFGKLSAPSIPTELSTSAGMSSNADFSFDDHDSWRIALYYCYIDIEDVQGNVDFQRHLCEKEGLTGRIRISSEGINGVLSGMVPALQSYEESLRAELMRLIPQDKNGGNWELDVKYCELRPELSVKVQLFETLICKETKAVVSLFEPENNVEDNKKKQGYSKQTNRRRRRQHQRREQQELVDEALPYNLRELSEKVPSMPGARHLSPQVWNEKLLDAEDAVLLDCRNVYESNIGHFKASDNVPTLLTNTRKYSDLPKVLVQSKDRWAHKKQIFMYCTGGVRCEQASKLVQAVVAKEQVGQEYEVYQLHGGIQRYLEHFHTTQKLVAQHKEEQGPCLYRGKNFVFDPRRTDPMRDNMMGESIVGKCCICNNPHDDYDNGHAPCENKEARCCRCRILLLVCNPCRDTVQCWGEESKDGLTKLYCGRDACCDYQITGANPVSIA